MDRSCMSLGRYRQDIPIVDDYTFLDHANMAPSPKQVIKAVREIMEEKAKFAYLSWEKWGKQIEEARESVAKLIGAKAKEEVWFMNNTSDGLNTAANMIDWRPKDNVVVSNLEYPSNVYPWLKKQKKGVKVRYTKSSYEPDGTIKIDIDEFDKLIDDRTKAVAVSGVDFGFGYNFDLKAISDIAHEHGALVVVDAIQSVGAVQMDVARDNVDIIAFGGQKWTLAPSGGGGFYIRADLLAQYEPPHLGWMSVTKPSEQFWGDYRSKYELAEDASRFGTGHPNFLGIIGLGAAAKYLLNVGLGNVEQTILSLTRRLIVELDELGYRILTPREDKRRAGIVSFEIRDPGTKIEKLRRKNIIVSGEAQTRGKGIRVSPHFYNSEEEIDDFVKEIRRFARED